jgi:hypothetical protein
MSQYDQKSLNLTEVDQKLAGHSKSAEFTATRGLVIELFPFIYEASERMSARAISRFLAEEQNIKLSQVTITRALGDAKKSWLSYFSDIEQEAKIIAKWGKSRSFKFLFFSKAEFERIATFEDEGFFGSKLAQGMVKVLRPDRAAAITVLREKWFSIGLGTRLKARQFLEEHLVTLQDKL